MNKERMGRLALVGLSVAANARLVESSIERGIGSSGHRDEATNVLDAGERGQIEGQWLKIPAMCKDRSISVDPRVVTGETMSPELAAIHAALDGEPALA
jgi:hypothetical protein